MLEVIPECIFKLVPDFQVCVLKLICTRIVKVNRRDLFASLKEDIEESNRNDKVKANLAEYRPYVIR